MHKPEIQIGNSGLVRCTQKVPVIDPKVTNNRSQRLSSARKALVGERAHELHRSRDCDPCQGAQDWLLAEQEILKQ
jgi:hypothetical protein